MQNGIAISEDEKNRLMEIQERLSQVENEKQNIVKHGSIKIQNIEQRREIILAGIASCEDEILKCFEERNEAIENVDMQKNNQLAVIEKQTTFQKIIGRIGNMFNGAKKFQNEVINVVSANISRIKDEEFPRIKEEVEIRMVEFSIEMYNTRMERKDKIEQQKIEMAELKAERKAQREERKTQKQEAREERRNQIETEKAERIAQREERKAQREAAREERRTQRAEAREEERIQKEAVKAEKTAQRAERKAQRKEDWDKFRNGVKNRTQHTIETISAKGREAKLAILEKANDSLQKAIEKSMTANQEKSGRLATAIGKDVTR